MKNCHDCRRRRQNCQEPRMQQSGRTAIYPALLSSRGLKPADMARESHQSG